MLQWHDKDITITLEGTGPELRTQRTGNPDVCVHVSTCERDLVKKRDDPNSNGQQDSRCLRNNLSFNMKWNFRPTQGASVSQTSSPLSCVNTLHPCLAAICLHVTSLPSHLPVHTTAHCRALQLAVLTPVSHCVLAFPGHCIRSGELASVLR